MRDLIDIFIAKIHWALFILLEGISLFLLFRFNPYQESVWFGKATAFSGFVNEKAAEWAFYTSLIEENRNLTRRNIILQNNLNVARERIETLTHDTMLTERLQTERIAGIRQIPARVVDNSIRRKDNIILIDKGSADGVKPEMGVVSGTGVVGIVAQAGSHYASVLPVLNSHSSISCRIRGTRYFGYLRWYGGGTLGATLEDVPHHARVKVGDVVETSGFSKVFPEGLFVGRVVGINDSADGQAYTMQVQLSTDIAHVHQVVVLDNVDKEEMEELK